MGQDVAELVPRVRRAIEGPVVETGPAALSDAAIVAMAADAIADVILLTAGRWSHTLNVAERDGQGLPNAWEVDPALSLPEESVIAAQAAITYFFHQVRGVRTSEQIVNEGQTWSYSISANLLRDQIKLLQEQRDAALAALLDHSPVLARYASLLAARDQLGAALLEPWTSGDLGGGQLLLP